MASSAIAAAAAVPAAAAVRAATTSSTLSWSSRITSIPATYPFAFGVVFSGFKTSLSDLLVQTVVERKEKIDWRRNAAFASFGFVYLGAVQYSLYVPIFGRLFPQAAAFAKKPLRDKLKDKKGLWQLFAQVFLDQCVHHPFMYFPAFYCTKELVMASKGDNKQPDLKRALADYRRNMKEDLGALWKIWVPATIINFSFMPMHLRIPFAAGVSLLWTCVLSTMRGGDVVHGQDLAGGAVTGATLTILKEGLSEWHIFAHKLELDRDKSHVVITASGKDKPGWVALLSRAVANEGGNVTHSKMVRLGREFIIQMHVAVPANEHSKLVKALRNNKLLRPLNLNCNTITRRHTGTFDAPLVGVHLRCVGTDRPGILAAISEKCLETGLSMESVTTELLQRRGTKSSANLGENSIRREFVVTADCVATKYMNEEQILKMAADLGTLKDSLHLDVVDVRVQRLSSLDSNGPTNKNV